MRDFNTKLIAALAQGEFIHNLFCHPLDNAINLLLESERTVFLNYEKWQMKGYNKGNSKK